MTMTDSNAESTARADAFGEAVAERKLKTGRPGGDRALRILAVVLMVLGVVGTFLAYNNSLQVDDSRDVASNQILAVAFLAITVVGAALFVVAGIAAVLRLWLLRQLVESQDRSDELIRALSARS
jgi:protein-S-isoprenylcysteine O-methyltransferase Ste14